MRPTAVIGAFIALVGSAARADDELHVVGVYEARPAVEWTADDREQCLAACEGRPAPRACASQCWSGSSDGRSPITVTVKRPGQTVTLVLGAVEAVDWEVTVGSDTVLERIVLVGRRNAEEASVTTDDGDRPTVIPRRDVASAYDIQGPVFRRLVESLPVEYGFEQLHSFQGAYKAPAAGFTIDRVQTDVDELHPDYLRLRRVAVGADDTLRIHGIIAGRLGEFRADGALVAEQPLVMDDKVAIDPTEDRAFVWDRQDAVYELDTVSNRILRVMPPPGYWSYVDRAALTFDSERERLVAAFQSGEIRAFKLSGSDWRVLGETGEDAPTSIYYDAVTDRYLVAGEDEHRETAFVGVMTPQGDYTKLHELELTEFDGLMDLRPLAGAVRIVGVEGDRIALGVAVTALHCIYVLDLGSGEVDLTYYDPDPPWSAARN